MSTLARLEFWTDVEPANGFRRALIPAWVACSEEVTLEGEDTMYLTLLRDNPALVTIGTATADPNGDPLDTNAEPNLVLRAVYDDGNVVERRIEVLEERDDNGLVQVNIVARGILHDLSARGMVFREHPDGTRTYHFQASGLTAAEHITNYLLPALQEAGQTFWSIGVIESTEPVAVVYSADSPLGALRKLETATGMELAVRYDPNPQLSTGVGRYLIDLVQQVGSAAPIVRVHVGLNLLATGFGRSAADVVNRVYAFGASDPEFGQSTMGGNVWVPKGLRTDPLGNLWMQVADPAGGPGPIAFDHQYGPTPEGQHRFVTINEPTYADYYIMDCLAASQEFRILPYTAGQQSLVPLYRIMHGARSLAYVEETTSRTLLQPRVGYAERPEAGMHLNHIRNPLCRLLGTIGVPSAEVGLADWYRGGSVSVTLEDNPIYWRTGGRALRCTFSDTSAQVVALGYGTGFGGGRLSYFGDVRVLSGQVQVGMVVNLKAPQLLPNGSTAQQLLYPNNWLRLYPTLTDDDIPRPQNVGADNWERLGLEGCHDCTAYPALTAWVWFEAVTVPTTVLIDAAQITNTATQRDLVEGSGSNALIQAANEKLARYATLGVSLGLDVLDFSTVDDPRFPINRYVIGGRIQAYNERMAQAVQTRVLGWTRDWMEKERLRVQVSSARTDLARILARRGPITPAGR